MLRIFKFKKLLTIILVLSFILFSVLPGSTSNIYAYTAVNAETAMDDFLDVFYNPVEKYFYTNSDRQIHEHAPGPQSGLIGILYLLVFY